MKILVVLAKVLQIHIYDHKNKVLVFSGYFALLHCANHGRKTWSFRFWLVFELFVNTVPFIGFSPPSISSPIQIFICNEVFLNIKRILWSSLLKKKNSKNWNLIIYKEMKILKFPEIPQPLKNSVWEKVQVIQTF